MQAGALESELAETQQSLKATQAASLEQSQLLEQQRIIVNQHSAVMQIDRLEQDISQAQEVHIVCNLQACTHKSA